jgi:hypothetical protein
MKSLSILFFAVSLVGFAQTTAPSGPMNNQRVIALVQAGLSAADVSRIISSAPTVDFSLSPPLTEQLLKYGVSEDTIKLMAARQMGIAPRPARQALPTVVSLLPATASSAQPATARMPDDIGVYYMSAGEWTEIEPEVVNWKTGGVLKNLVTLGIVRGDINGHVRTGQSKTKIRSNEILVITPEGVSVTEYQLLRMRQHESSREMRAVTGGILHVSGGSDRDILDFEHRKIGKRAFIVTLPPSLEDGNYGLLPPGAFGSRSATSLGKIYTFRIVN